eukprot:CAMPEP_0182930178 /NCGR_PEP_ID=MMETSP0105_2-20130417/24160_1 /TAXON_ID=81532 ORGANISM="Acanthoeca-like sp., Strain 10tr" /NCGR_SAMPLE_ID=MMETSP0105_2 /ASSEMBLY_ACC=CAM_ASM_000205 /LENGTH=40 /DNA_ID= /DNA_START= /DNA_END= /DNA_ORIENTATION=
MKGKGVGSGLKECVTYFVDRFVDDALQSLFECCHQHPDGA